MTEKLEQQIKESTINLPKELQEAISSSDWVNISSKIGQVFLLNEDEINNLQLHISLVLLQLKPLNMLVINIEYEVNTSKNEAEKIAGELTDKIFTPIGNKLNEIIKNSGRDKMASWKQNINFIVSGGDYTVFMEK